MHRWLNQLAVENPRNLFKTYRGGKAAEVLSTESRASASEVPWEMKNRRGLDALQNGWRTMFNQLSGN